MIEKYPVIDTGLCSKCQGCAEIAADVFFLNSATGLMDTFWSDTYPQELVDEAIKNCPKDCIAWSE